MAGDDACGASQGATPVGVCASEGKALAVDVDADVPWLCGIVACASACVCVRTACVGCAITIGWMVKNGSFMPPLLTSATSCSATNTVSWVK